MSGPLSGIHCKEKPGCKLTICHHHLISKSKATESRGVCGAASPSDGWMPEKIPKFKKNKKKKEPKTDFICAALV